MAGKSRWQMIYSILLTEVNNGDVLHVDKIRQIIRKKLASQPYTIKSYLKLMEESGLTKEVEPYMFKINLNAT